MRLRCSMGCPGPARAETRWIGPRVKGCWKRATTRSADRVLSAGGRAWGRRRRPSRCRVHRLEAEESELGLRRLGDRLDATRSRGRGWPSAQPRPRATAPPSAKPNSFASMPGHRLLSPAKRRQPGRPRRITSPLRSGRQLLRLSTGLRLGRCRRNYRPSNRRPPR